MKVLLVGNGAREHIIAERMAEGGELLAAMGKNNPGISGLASAAKVFDAFEPQAVAKWAAEKKADLAFVGPDALLAAGFGDALENAGVPIASPTKAASRIEWDKSYARSLMKGHSIPGLPEFQIVNSESEARKAIKDLGGVAVKPLGLTGGKGVRVSGDHFKSAEEAIAYACEVIRSDGSALIEEKLEGEEFSLQLFSDGNRVSPMPPVQDHKRAYEGDVGPNTGGMGSYTTGDLLPFMRKTDLEEALGISQKVVDAMRKSGTPFKGVLYTQGMCTKSGLKIIEFNARFGDPEAMNALSLIQSDFTSVLQSISDGNLRPPQFSKNASVVKYLVPEGYPDNPVPDSPISVDTARMSSSGAAFYYASVYGKEGIIYTTSSRAVGVVGVAGSISQAEQIAESATAFVSGPLWHRKDIGSKELLEKRISHMGALRK